MNWENYLIDFMAGKHGLLLIYGNYRKGLKGFDEGNMENCSR